MHGDLTEAPLPYRVNCWVANGPQQGRHPPHLVAKGVLALLPVDCRCACAHVGLVTRLSARTW